jgi:uracil-DNA glycosylase family 4
MEEFNELELQKLIDFALSNTDSSHPFGNSGTYLGLAETDILSLVYSRLENKMAISQMAELFHDIRNDILSRKISTNIRDLHTITKNCDKCKLNSTPELPKWNVKDPDVVIILESPSVSPEAITLMIDAFKSAGFNSDQLCLTYVNRCPIRRKFENQEVTNCSPYLHLELQLLNPKLIICLGGLPSSVLFGTQIKIKDVRSSITWLGYWPIVSTYSPMYVLKSGGNIPNQFCADIKQAYDFVASKSKVKNDN